MKSCGGCGAEKPLTEFYRIRKGSQYRSYCKACSSARNKQNRAKAAARKRAEGLVDREGSRRLPIAPFRGWLVSLGRTDKDLGAMLGVDPRRIYEWRVMADYVWLDSADRSFCRFGDPTLLKELYPFLYEFDLGRWDGEGVCPRGLHDVTDRESVYVKPNGTRSCRLCRRDSDVRRRAAA